MALLFPEYESFDALGLANLVSSGVLSPLEIVEAAIERIELRNPELNAVIHKMYDQARVAAKGNLSSGVFTGVPILLKDVLADVADTPICCGSRFNFVNKWMSKNDSELVKRLRQSGVVILGKTNLPELGLGPVTEPVLFGPTRNPWNVEHTPGGSSGGAAAAVASGMVPIAHGGDGGGSIRMPAAFTGLFGLKPSRGRTPVGPLLMRAWQGMVVEHALSRSVRDSAAMLDVLAGPELGSPISLPRPDVSFLSQLDVPPPKLRIALIEQSFFEADVNPEYIHALHQAAKLCQDLGHEVIPATFVLDDDVAFAFIIILMAETSAAVKELSKLMGRKPLAHELETSTVILYQLADKFTAADFAWAMHVMDMTGLKLATFFQQYDLILTPTVPFAAPKIGAYKLDYLEEFGLKMLRYIPYGQTLRQFIQRACAKKFTFMAYTALFNIGGNPAMSVPLFQDKNGMPIGIQFAAKLGDELTLLQLARELEQIKPWSYQL